MGLTFKKLFRNLCLSSEWIVALQGCNHEAIGWLVKLGFSFSHCNLLTQHSAPNTLHPVSLGAVLLKAAPDFPEYSKPQLFEKLTKNPSFVEP